MSRPHAPPPLLSVVTPAYNEAANLEAFHERLQAALAAVAEPWEWVIVDDHSEDATFARACAIARRDVRVRALRLSRNSGSHAALACGLGEARGRAVALMASDLEDPPELLPRLLERWRDGVQVVWGARRSARPALASRLFHRWFGRGIGPAGCPEGADMALLDRRIVDALHAAGERNTNLFALIAWLGFRQEAVPYDKARRIAGRSGWSLRKKMQLAADSVTGFSLAPIRAMLKVGLIVGFVGVLYAAWVTVNYFFGRPPAGWSSLMIVVLLLGGMQAVFAGILGEYLWRALQESRRRVPYAIEATSDEAGARTAGEGSDAASREP